MVKPLEIVFVILCVTVVAVAVLIWVPVSQTAPNCRQYLDKAIELVERSPSQALAYAKIAEVCTKF